MESIIIEKLNYWVFITLMMLGLWAMLSKKNLIKKIMGMSIFQAAVIMFYVSIGAKDQHANIPIYPHDLIHPEHAEHGASDHGEHPADTAHGETHAHGVDSAPQGHEPHEGHPQAIKQLAHAHVDPSKTANSEHHESTAHLINPTDFDNPLPHVLMLTAIVVGVATLGVALALIQRLYRHFGTIEEDQILEALAQDSEEAMSISSMNQTIEKSPTNHA